MASLGCLSRRPLRLSENARHPQETQGHLDGFLRRPISRESPQVQNTR
jgi:hypothetical protein